MKKISIAIVLFFVGFSIANSQVPEKFNYQGIIRNSSGELIENTDISIQISLLEGSATGSAVYTEQHDVTTNAYGQFAVQVGNGIPVSGNFSTVNWASGQVYLKTEVDESGGDSYTEIGVVQLVTVPYAIYAKDVENKDDADANPSNEIQDLDLTSNILTITNNPSPTEINLAAYQGTNTDEQVLDLTGTNLSISGGNFVDLSPIQDGVDDADNNSSNELQNLTLDGDTLKISNGNEVVLPYDSSNWVIQGNTMYYNGGNVGIGSSAPVSNLEVKANTAGSDALFQVINANNDTVFAVYPDGVKIFIDPTAKGKVGGFAVSGRTSTKLGEVDIMRITPDSTRIYVNENITGKGKVGGFAVSGRTSTKGLIKDYLVVTGDSTRIYVDSTAAKGKVGGFAVSGRTSTKGSYENYLQVTRDSTRIYITEGGTKGKVGGFAVSGRTSTKGVNQNIFIATIDSTRIFTKDTISGFGVGSLNTSGAQSYLRLNPQNYFIGHESGKNNTSGLYNSFLGYQTGYHNLWGESNVFIGYQAGFSNETGRFNNFIGYQSGYSNKKGDYNDYMGYKTGMTDTSGQQNVLIGFEAGKSAVNNFQTTIIGAMASSAAILNSASVLIGTETAQFTRRIEGTVMIGTDAGRLCDTTYNDVFIGRDAGMWINKSYGNIFLGYRAATKMTYGTGNIFIGTSAGYDSNEGDKNTVIGFLAGYKCNGDNNVFIGANAGYNETGSDKLYIDNTNTSTPLIGGDFSADKVNISNVLNLTGVSDYPTSPSVGDIIRLEGHSSDRDGLYIYDGSDWVSIVDWS